MPESSLYERYRPSTWAEVVGQDKIVNRVRQLGARSGLSGRAFWISGGSGQGKSTIGKLIAREVADDFFIEELDAAALTVSRLAEIERESATKGWDESRPGRAYLINESHALRKDVIRLFLVILERIPAHVVYVFTTTNENEEQLFEDCADASPLLSRCIELPLARRNLAEAFAKRAQEIAQREGLDGKPLASYVRLVNDKRGNLRAVLQYIESGAMME